MIFTPNFRSSGLQSPQSEAPRTPPHITPRHRMSRASLRSPDRSKPAEHSRVCRRGPSSPGAQSRPGEAATVGCCLAELEIPFCRVLCLVASPLVRRSLVPLVSSRDFWGHFRAFVIAPGWSGLLQVALAKVALAGCGILFIRGFCELPEEVLGDCSWPRLLEARAALEWCGLGAGEPLGIASGGSRVVAV